MNYRIIRKIAAGFFLIAIFVFSISALTDPGIAWVVDTGNHQIIKISPSGQEILRFNYQPMNNYHNTKIKSLTVSENDGNLLINKIDDNTQNGAINVQLIRYSNDGNIVFNFNDLYGNVFGVSNNPVNGNFYYLFNHVMARGHYELDIIYPDNSSKNLFITFFNEATALATDKSDGSIWVTSPALMDLSEQLFKVILTKFTVTGQKLFAISAEPALLGFQGGQQIVVNSNDGSCVISLTNVNTVPQKITDLVKYDKNGNQTNHISTFSNIKCIAVDESDGAYWVLDENSIIKLDSNFNEIIRLNIFDSPSFIALDRGNGNLWISNTGGHNVIKLDSAGNELFGLSFFDTPVNIAVIPSL